MQPWSIFLKERKKRLSDIEYLAKKDFDGKIRSAEGGRSTTGDLATLTATSGKDMYLANAKCSIFTNASTNNATPTEVVLKLNGTIIETTKASFQGGSGVAQGKGSGSYEYEFKNIGQKVAATEIIKLEVIAITATTDVEGFIEVFEEATGADPVL